MRAKSPMWRMQQAVVFLDKLRPLVTEAGYGLGLCGSVLERGDSLKDLDIIVFPLRSEQKDIEKLYKALRKAGLRRWMNTEAVHKAWRDQNSNDTKHVEVWKTVPNLDDIHERRIDIFFLS